MASAVNRLGFYARSSRSCLRISRPCRLELQAPWQQQPQQARCFSATPPSFAKNEEESEAQEEDQVIDEEFLELKRDGADLGEDVPSKDQALQEIFTGVDPSLLSAYVEERPEKKSDGFWAEGEPDMGEDEEWYGDDISSHGHGELEQQREIREYLRIAAWEMPLLAKYAKPFEPPTSQTPLRFRYTTYMGEQHPAQRKVVLEFSVSDMPDLTRVQRDKLIKLAGPRYNPDTDILKMSAENFETQAQNKRYLGDLVASLLKEAKNSEDTFEDVPFDFRHHRPKVFHHFPKEWIITPERKKLLAQRRQERLQLEQERVAEGKLVDGNSVVATALATPFEQRLAPVMVEKGKARTKRPGMQTLGARLR